MAGKGSKMEIESVLMQAMLAAKTVRAQRDRLLQLQHRLQDDPDATATAKSGSSKRRQGQAARGGGGDVGKSLDYLYRACRITSLAVKHIDVAVAVLSRFMDPKRLASLAEFCDEHAYISEEGFYLASD